MKEKEQNYSPPFWMLGTHIETVYPALFRKVSFKDPKTERIDTSDNDFLDADFYYQNSKALVIISHGLEGNSRRPYVKGMAKAFFKKGLDVCCWNYRGCSGEMNKTLLFYHSGATYDLQTIIDYVVAKNIYDTLYLIGFSLGGNLTLKYLGEGRKLPIQLKRAVVISVPVDLAGSSEVISQIHNKIYEWKFLNTLKKKILEKSQSLPMETWKLKDVITLRDFDNAYTAPIHGFLDANDYYKKSSSRFLLKNIDTPVLIINAKNDTFLSSECFPENNTYSDKVNWCVTERGGHVGFTGQSDYFSEEKALEFILYS